MFFTLQCVRVMVNDLLNLICRYIRIE